MEFTHEIGSWGDKILAAQKKMGSRFYFQTQRTNSILKFMSKFMFSKITVAYTQTCDQLYSISAGMTKYDIGNCFCKLEQTFFKIYNMSQS